jgi:hypothetical protein
MKAIHCTFLMRGKWLNALCSLFLILRTKESEQRLEGSRLRWYPKIS